MKNNYAFLSLIIVTIVISPSLSDLISYPEVMKTFNVKILREGIDTVVPNNHENLLFWVRIFTYNKDGSKNILFNDPVSYINSFGKMPQCIEYVAQRMSIMEKLEIDCKKEIGFKDEHLYKFDYKIEKNKDYFVDLQLWKIAPVGERVE